MASAGPARSRCPARCALMPILKRSRLRIACSRGCFRGDPKVIGRALSVDGRPATIAAVLSEAFHPQLQTFGVIVDLDTVEPAAYRMLRADPPPQAITPATGVRIYQAIGELKAGVTIEQTRAEIDAIHTREQRDHPATSVVVTPCRTSLSVRRGARCVVDEDAPHQPARRHRRSAGDC